MCKCGHESFNHTMFHPVWHGISVCLVRGYGFLGLSRCNCLGYEPVDELDAS